MKQSRFNWFYAFIILLFLGMLYISARYFKGSSNSSVGIASSKEYKISADKAAVVKNVSVVPGQQVKAGDLLIELSSAELDMDIDKLTNRIAVMKADQSAKSKLLESKIAFIRADEGVTDEELSAEIEQTKSEVDLNKSLTKAFTKDTTTTSSSSNPLQVKINSLKTQQRKHQQATDIRIQDIIKENELDQTQLTNQIRLASQELDLLKEEKKKMSKYAVADGVIDNVYVKMGEQVDAFTGLLAVTPVHPTTVIAYLVGPKSYRLDVGASVTVKAYGQPSTQVITGKVIGYGSVTELPEILQKSTAVKAFGREVFIEISGANDFANGQKVLIR
jgi:multidrug resistance efflux pump